MRYFFKNLIHDALESSGCTIKSKRLSVEYIFPFRHENAVLYFYS